MAERLEAKRATFYLSRHPRDFLARCSQRCVLCLPASLPFAKQSVLPPLLLGACVAVRSATVVPRSSLQCLQYKATQQSELKRVDKLNDLFFSLMATGKPPAGEDVAMPQAKPIKGKP